MRKRNGDLHFYINGVDQGIAATHVPSNLFAVVDLYGQATQATIVQPGGKWEFSKPYQTGLVSTR